MQFGEWFAFINARDLVSDVQHEYIIVSYINHSPCDIVAQITQCLQGHTNKKNELIQNYMGTHGFPFFFPCFFDYEKGEVIGRV